jgi:hypothetical protein
VESNWKWNCERFGYCGYLAVPFAYGSSIIRAAELNPPLVVVGESWKCLLQVGLNSAWKGVIARSLLGNGPFLPLIPTAFLGNFPYGITVLPDH